MDNAEVKFRLDVFEGPLDLLLHLIKTNELDINEISLSKITEQYLDTMRLMEAMDLEVAGDYLVMAATLINVKLRALLPSPEEEVEPENEEDLDDFMNAKTLLARLIEYRKFKEAAAKLGDRAERQARIFMRDVALPKLSQAEDDDALKGDLGLLLAAFARVIRFVDRRDYHQVQAEEFTIEDKIALLRRRLVTNDRIEMIEVFEACRSKVEAITTIIAVLELCRLKELRVIQGDSYDSILLVARRGDDPEHEAMMDEQARQAKEMEADILANRTGVVDDGVLPDEDDEAQEIEASVLAEASGPVEEPDKEAIPDEESPDADAWDTPEAFATEAAALASDATAAAETVTLAEAIEELAVTPDANTNADENEGSSGQGARVIDMTAEIATEDVSPLDAGAVDAFDAPTGSDDRHDGPGSGAGEDA